MLLIRRIWISIKLYHMIQNIQAHSTGLFLNIFILRFCLRDFLLYGGFTSFSLYEYFNKSTYITKFFLYVKLFGTYRQNVGTTMIDVKYISLHFITWKIEYEINIRLTLSAFLSSPYFACAVNVAEGYSNWRMHKRISNERAYFVEEGTLPSRLVWRKFA